MAVSFAQAEEPNAFLLSRHCTQDDAIGLEFCRAGRPPEIIFGWSQETPLAANLNFLLFGKGNIPWMVNALVCKAEPHEERRPRIVVG